MSEIEPISPEIRELLSICEEHDSSLLSEEEQILFQALSTGEGRSALAQSMMAPIRRSLDYQGIGRRLFQVEEMPQSHVFAPFVPLQETPVLEISPQRRRDNSGERISSLEID